MHEKRVTRIDLFTPKFIGIQFYWAEISQKKHTCLIVVHAVYLTVICMGTSWPPRIPLNRFHFVKYLPTSLEHKPCGQV